MIKKHLVVALMCLVAGSACTTVEPDEVGVLVSFGTLDKDVHSPGLYSTWFSTMNKMTTRTQNYTMAGRGTEAQADGAIAVLSKDQLSVQMDVSVQFHLNGEHAVKVFQCFGLSYADTIVHPLVRTAVRDAASEFTAIQLVDERARLQLKMEELVRASLRQTLRSRQVSESAIVVDNILLRNIDLPQSLDDAIANVQRQRQETAQRTQANLTAQQEAARARTEAEGQSQAALVRTRANAEARLIDARAQAEANRVVSQSITPEVLRMRQIEVMNSLLQSNGTRTIVLPTEHGVPVMLPMQTTNSQ